MTLTSPVRQTLSWIALGGLGLLAIWLLAPVLAPFVAATVAAYILQPLVEQLARRGLPRVLAVVIVEVAAVLVAAALLLLLVPILSKQLPLLRAQLPLLADRLNGGLAPLLAKLGIPLALDTATIKTFVLRAVNGNVEDWISKALSSARIGGSILVALVGNLVLVPVVLFYLLADWTNLIQRLGGLVPVRARPQVSSFVVECDAVLGQYLRGQLLVMVILAVFYSAGLALFGFELAVPVGVFTGLAVFIPYVGFGLGLVLAIISGVLQFGDWHGLLGVAVVYGIGQVFESMALTPRLVGKRIGMSPLTVIFALLAFGHLFGFVGVLIALPVSALLVVVMRRVKAGYLQSPLYLG